jgi:NitT/TauT family transport system substrate-binding protein
VGPAGSNTANRGCTLKLFALLRAALVLAALVAANPAAALDKVTFATNWLAEAEHGGFYQAKADGTYEKYGLDVTILQGGPNANNRLLLAAGKIEFALGANLIQAFDAAAGEIPIVAVAALFQKDPFILMSLCLRLPMAEARLRLSGRKRQTLHIQLGALHR